jgi:tetratricopeptide (TPR) repeat protein
MPPSEYVRHDIEGAVRAFGYKIKYADEAIDEYEATIDLKPDYFPALTRLAYLYYKQGYAARAIEMWRRSLPHCTDTNLRHNIEVFMRKLIADMNSRG